MLWRGGITICARVLLPAELDLLGCNPNHLMVSRSRSTRRPIDRDQFLHLAGAAIGLPISAAWRGYGSALMLELGRLKADATPRRTSRGKTLTRLRGEIGIMIQWSWRVERARSIQFGSWSTDGRIDGGIGGLAGPRVISVDCIARLPELVVGMSDGRWIQAFMTAEGQPAWTLFLRDGSWLTVDRGRLIHDVQNQAPGQTHRADSA